MLIAISKYLKSLAEVDVYRQQHLDYIKPLMASGKLLMAGRQKPVAGAVIIAANDLTADEFKQILKKDPYVQAGVTEYEIIEFAATLYHPSVKFLL